MTVISPVTTPIAQIQIEPGSVVKFTNLTWLEFAALLQEWGEDRAARMTYYQNILEVMVPLPEHEVLKKIIADIVKILLKKTNRNFQSFGSTMFKQEGIVGLEPDACFYIANAQQMLDRRRLDPDDPPPDLAIEIDLNSRTSLGAYAALSVPELWIYEPPNLRIYILENSTYQQRDRSPLFANLPLPEIIAETLEQSWKIGYSQALNTFESAIASWL
jgi:Uma2 family endonuclease